MYIDTMQQVLASTSKVMMDYKSGGNLLYLPLDQLLQRAGVDHSGSMSGAPRSAPLEVPPSSTDVSPRSRDSLRGRGRGERP